MSLGEIRKAIQGTSIANRRRGLKAHATRMRNLKAVASTIATVGAALSEYDNFQKNTYGGIVERTILRTPIRTDMGAPETIPFQTAQYECSRFAEVRETAGTEFNRFEGKQIQYLLTLDGVFMYPSQTGAFAEILDAGCAVRTKLAVYTLADRQIMKS